MRASAGLSACLGCVLALVGCKAEHGPDDDPYYYGDGEDMSRPPPPTGDGPTTSYPDLRGASDPDRACASVRASTTIVKKPVDIIFVIDNSGSMSDEIAAVQKNINKNFAEVIGKSGIDYKVLMLSAYGFWGAGQICVSQPLSGIMDCVLMRPFCPISGMRFQHYSMEIDSNDSLEQLLKALTTKDPLCTIAPMGIDKLLRDDAFRVVIEITDDNSSMSADEFENQLFAKSAKFGTKADRNYVFHTIAGLKQNAPATKPWDPGDPIQMATCGSGAVNNGQVYQELSVRTGGLRFPICEHASFEPVFQEVAKGVITGARINCDFPIPAPPAGQMIDMDTIRVEFTPGAGASQLFKKVPSAGACAPGSFYLDGGKINLCPDACKTVQADSAAKIEILFDCAIQVG